VRPNRMLFPPLALGSDTAALRPPDFRIGLGERLAVLTPERKQVSKLEVCTVCGDLRDPAVGYCSGCGSRELTPVGDEPPADPRFRLVQRVAHSLAAEAALHVRSAPEGPTGAALTEGRAIYTRLGSQRRVLRDRLLAARTPEERELYREVLRRVERVLSRSARPA